MKIIKVFLPFLIIGVVAYLIVGRPHSVLTQTQFFELQGDTFDMDVRVLITDDTAYAREFVREHLDSSVTTEDFNSRATTFGTKDGESPIVWFSKTDDQGVVAHELFHVTLDIMKWANIPLGDSTEEVYSYELQHLTNQFYKQLNKLQ